MGVQFKLYRPARIWRNTDGPTVMADIQLVAWGDLRMNVELSVRPASGFNPRVSYFLFPMSLAMYSHVLAKPCLDVWNLVRSQMARNRRLFRLLTQVLPLPRDLGTTDSCCYFDAHK